MAPRCWLRAIFLGTSGLAVWCAQIATLVTPPPSPFAAKGVVFSDRSAMSGLSRFHHIAGSAHKPYLPETIGSGVALVDFDNDGWLDAYFLTALSTNARLGKEPPQRSALFRNNRDGTFTDVTVRTGTENYRWGAGVCAGDFDNDGWEDLYVTNFGKSRLYRNNGGKSFTDIAEKAGVAVDTWATGCAFGDYDRDGLLDLFVAGYVDFDWQHPPPSRRTGAPPTLLPGQLSPTPSLAPAFDPGKPSCTFFGVVVACGPLGLKGAPDHLFRNLGNGRFVDVTTRSGVQDKDLRYGLAAGWVDVDDDGWPDLVVANDSGANYLYRNKRNGTFEEIGMLSGLGTNGDGREQAYMGMAAGDYDRDGRVDFLFTTFSGDNYTLHRGLGNLDFLDVSIPAGIAQVTMPFLGWGAEFLDHDNDGWLDLVTANGHVFPQANPETWKTSYQQRTLLLRNVEGRFYDVSGSAGSAWSRVRSSRGVATGDLQNRGVADIVLNNLDGTPTLLWHDAPAAAGNSISIQLIGDPSRGTPRDGIGSVVFCETGKIRQRADVASGRGYLSQSDLRVRFGLGDRSVVDRLLIRWAGGGVETYARLKANSRIVIEEGKGIRTP